MRRLMTSEEVGAILGKKAWWVRENIYSLGIPAIKVGRQWRFDEEAIEAWLRLNEIS